MIVYNVVDFKEYLVNETNANYHIVYEKVESIEAKVNNNSVHEKKQGVVEMIKILQGASQNDSLRCIYTQELGERCKSFEEVVDLIKKEQQHIFI